MKIDFILICILWGIYVCNQNNTIISSFYPQFALAKFGLEELIVGFIFSAHPVGIFASSLILAKIMNKQGMKKNCSILGMLIQALSSGMFIFLEYIDSELVFIILSIVSRIFMGIGQGLFCTPSYSYLPVLYGHDLERIIAYIEAVAGIGLSLGPLFGGLLFEAAGYKSIFIFNIIISLVIIPVQMIYMPYQLEKIVKHDFKVQEAADIKVDHSAQHNLAVKDKSEIVFMSENHALINNNYTTDIKNDNIGIQNFDSNKITENEQNSSTNNQTEYEKNEREDVALNNEKQISIYEFQINYKELLSHLNIIFSCILVFIPTALTGYLDPCLGPYAHEEYHLDEGVIGLIFFAGAAIYIIMIPVSTILTKKTKQYKRMLFVGSFLSGGSMLIISPSMGIAKSKLWLYIGQATLNAGNALIYIPVIPDMIQTLQKIYPEEDEGIMGDLSSALYNSSFALGYFFGPAVGGLLVTLTTFPKTSFYLGVFLVTFSFLFLIFGGVIKQRQIDIQREKFKNSMPVVQGQTSRIRQQEGLVGSMVSRRSVMINLNQKKQSQLVYNKSFQDSLLNQDHNNLKNPQGDALARPISQNYKHGPLVRLTKESSQSMMQRFSKSQLRQTSFKNDMQKPLLKSYQE